MGVKLWELVKGEEISFDDLKNKKIAVDSSGMIYQFLASIRQRDGTPLMDSNGNVTSHLQGIFSRITNLSSKGLKLAFIFDGKPPLLKLKEQEARSLRKQLASEKLEEAKQEEDIDSMLKYSKQTIRINKQIVEESKELLTLMGLPVIQAPSEAEAQCAFMAEKKDVDLVASQDADALLYGTPKLIRNLTLSQRRRLPSGSYIQTFPEIVTLSKVLNDLGIDQDQLLALAILVGTDYNIGGVRRIGPKTALKLVKQHHSFDKIFKEVEADFNWKEIYAVFKSMPVMKNYQLKWSKPDVEKIKKLLVDKHEFSEERVDSTLEKLTKITKAKEQIGLGKWQT